jgi:hypothetical protein
LPQEVNQSLVGIAKGNGSEPVPLLIRLDHKDDILFVNTEDAVYEQAAAMLAAQQFIKEWHNHVLFRQFYLGRIAVTEGVADK